MGLHHHRVREVHGEKCVGERAVVLKQEVAGFEKFIMGPYSFIT